MSSVAGKKMRDEADQCKYFCSGYCKFKSSCKLIHPKETCDGQDCMIKQCMKKHPKLCRYKEKCIKGNFFFMNKHTNVHNTLRETRRLQKNLLQEKQ